MGPNFLWEQSYSSNEEESEEDYIDINDYHKGNKRTPSLNVEKIYM